MTARAAFKKADVQRAVEGVLASGLPVARIEFNDNGFAVLVGEAEKGRRRNKADDLYGAS
jgi:hypothetical protein